MMMATCSLMSRINLSATPGCVCRTVQQMWMLDKEENLHYLLHRLLTTCHHITSYQISMFTDYFFHLRTWMGTAVCSDSSPLTSVHLTDGKYQKHQSPLPPLTPLDLRTQTRL